MNLTRYYPRKTWLLNHVVRSQWISWLLLFSWNGLTAGISDRHLIHGTPFIDCSIRCEREGQTPSSSNRKKETKTNRQKQEAGFVSLALCSVTLVLLYLRQRIPAEWKMIVNKEKPVLFGLCVSSQNVHPVRQESGRQLTCSLPGSGRRQGQHTKGREVMEGKMVDSFLLPCGLR